MTDLMIGPDQGRLTLHTGVEGRAAKMGHALTILMNDWSGTVTLDGPEPTSLTLRASLSSLEVVSGEGGVKPLSDKDKRTVKASALETLAADAHPDVTFTSRAITAHDDGYAVQGDLSLNGRTSPCTIPVAVRRSGGTVSVDAAVQGVQTAFGVKPYSGLMGGLKVKDAVEVRLSAVFPEPA